MAKKSDEVKIPSKKTKVKAKTNTNPMHESRVMEILKTEYAIENWLLAILSPILILYGVYIVAGKFGTVNLASILSSSNSGVVLFFFETALRRILTGSFLIIIGTVVLVYLIIPYVKPSMIELKKISWPTTQTLSSNIAKVFIFLLFLATFFTLLGYGFTPFFNWLTK